MIRVAIEHDSGEPICVVSVRSGEEAERIAQQLRQYVLPVPYDADGLPLRARWYDEEAGADDLRALRRKHHGNEYAVACEELSAPAPTLGERLRRSADAQAAARRESERHGRDRAVAAAEMHEGGATFAQIAAVAGISRARAQQLVEQGRELRGG